jgi:hypothetical protein
MVSMTRIEVILLIEWHGYYVDGRNRESGFLYFEVGEAV